MLTSELAQKSQDAFLPLVCRISIRIELNSQHSVYRYEPEVILEFPDPCESVRAYALVSPKLAAAYPHHYGDHTTIAEGVQITLPVPEIPSLAWISTENYSPKSPANL